MHSVPYTIILSLITTFQLSLPLFGLDDWSVVVMIVAVVFAIGAF